MKKAILLFTLCAVSFYYATVKAQSDRNEKTSVTLFRLPLEPLPKEYASYELKAITLDSRKSAVGSKVQIPGFAQKNDGSADVILEFNETPGKIFSVDAQTTEKEVTNNGVKKKITYYYAKVRYQHAISFTATDKTGKKLINKVYSDQGYREFNTQEYSTYNDMKNRYQGEFDTREQGEFNNALNDISGMLANKYGYSKYRMSILICSVKPKKYNYDNFNKATAMALVAMNQLDSLNKLVTDLKGSDFSGYPESYKPTLDMFQESIRLWQEELKESNMEDRKARIDKDLTYDLYLNLTVAYIMLQDFDNARKSLDEALKIRGTWANIYDQDLKDLKARFHANYPEKFQKLYNIVKIKHSKRVLYFFMPSMLFIDKGYALLCPFKFIILPQKDLHEAKI